MWDGGLLYPESSLPLFTLAGVNSLLKKKTLNHLVTKIQGVMYDRIDRRIWSGSFREIVAFSCDGEKMLWPLMMDAVLLCNVAVRAPLGIQASEGWKNRHCERMVG